MAKQWDVLVLNDYEAVMPLTWNKKLGICYLYQPALTACLGVFGNAVTDRLLTAFLDHIPENYRYWDISLNAGNFFELKGYTLYQRMNYVLPLHNDYDLIYSKFRENIKRNIKKSEQAGNLVKKNIHIDEAVALAKKQSLQFSSITQQDFENFSLLCEKLYEKEKAITYGIYNAAGELMSSCIFFFSHHRAYYILPGNHPNGKTLGTSHALINAFIKDYAGENILLDFEGSDISSLAFFYSSFGAVEEKYSAIRLNRLPALVKWLKK